MAIQQKIILASKEDHYIDTNKTKKEIEKGLDFILSHLEEPIIFPRTIMTKKLGYQRKVYSKERALEHFIESDFIDCRINAFPLLKEGATWPPNLLFIDLDLEAFKSEKSLRLVLDNILKNIKKKLEDEKAYPTVLWSGNGYHIILPVYCPMELERIQEFQEYKKDRPSEQFLRFAKDNLSNNKADKANNPSFRSCLLRIPNSINGKCIAKEYNLEDSRVKIIQKWNGYRPSVKELLLDFQTCLIHKKIDERNQRQKILNMRNKNRNNNSSYVHYYEWIDKNILANPFSDYRKIIINLILAPYLVVIKKLSYEECFQIINEWLQKCDLLRKLDFNIRDLVNSALATAQKKQIPPMSIITLKTNYKDLYFLIVQNEKVEGG